jgi:hypothetical protein
MDQKTADKLGREIEQAIAGTVCRLGLKNCRCCLPTVAPDHQRSQTRTFPSAAALAR